MKKLAIFFLIVIAILSSISYLYLNYTSKYRQTKQENFKFETYINKEITGLELTTIINKGINENIINEVQKNEQGQYIDNGKNSINIDIKFFEEDEETTIDIENIYQRGTDEFLHFYRNIKFICNNVEYHKETGKIKYMLFEQIT